MDRYNFSLTTFSPSGKLGQIDHAIAAVNNGVISLGIKVKKQDSSLVLPSTIEKISQITPDICMAYSGMGPDFRVLVDKSRKSAHASYKNIYGSYPPTRMLVQEVAKLMQQATQSGGVRPFGVSVLVAGWDQYKGPSLYQVDPSGSYFAWKATAIGKSATSAKTFLEKRFSENLELDDAVHTALVTLKESFEGEMTNENVEIAVVSEEPAKHLLGVTGQRGLVGPRMRRLSPTEIQDYLDQV